MSAARRAAGVTDASGTHGGVPSVVSTSPTRTLNGSIDVTLPADFKGNVKLSADRGEIYSDFDFKLTGSPLVTQKNDTADGKFRVRVDRTMTGTINGGGTEATFKTYNGKIFIRKKK